jgi:amino acid permease
LSKGIDIDQKSQLSDPELDILPNMVMLSPNNVLRRTFMDRTFSKMGKGSLRGSIFSLCASAIGSGVLSLPYVLRLCGWVLGLSFIFVGAIAAVWSNTILAELAVDNKLANLSQLAIKAGGTKLEKSLSWMILVYMFGSCISYQIIITSLFKYVCSKFGMD